MSREIIWKYKVGMEFLNLRYCPSTGFVSNSQEDIMFFGIQHLGDLVEN